jgi:hypothetical protein
VTRPPQYGSWPTPPEFLSDAPPGAASPAAAPPGFRESRLKILQIHLRQGTISQEEYEQHLREMGLGEDQGLLPNVPKLLRKLSYQASTTRPTSMPIDTAVVDRDLGCFAAGHNRLA